jgi:predicted nuclease of predicted toxin-antitoxin system
MKLLFDENISYRIISLIKNHFPDSLHVSSIRKERFTDLDIWSYAKENDFDIVTYDADFFEWQLLRGYPPKIIWLRFGNSKTEIIADELIKSVNKIREFISEKDIGLLELYR